MVRPTLIDLNPVEYYSFMINLDKCNGSCNVLSQKICVPKKKNKQMLKYLIKLRQQKNIFHAIVNTNSIVQLAIQIKNGITKDVNVNVKIIVHANKDYGRNHGTFICENGRYLKSIADNPVIACDKVISVLDIVSTKMTNIISTNVVSTASVSFHSEKGWSKTDCSNLYTVLLAIILLMIITIICYHYAEHQYLKSVCIQNFPVLSFPAFALNTERYGVYLRIQFKRGEIRTRKSPNIDTFYAVHRSIQKGLIKMENNKFK